MHALTERSALNQSKKSTSYQVASRAYLKYYQRLSYLKDYNNLFKRNTYRQYFIKSTETLAGLTTVKIQCEINCMKT